MDDESFYLPLSAGREAVSAQVARRVLDLIHHRQLEIGSRLPSLDELSEQLGASRASVREAMKLLDAWGVITVRHGVGTFVSGLVKDSLLIPFKVSAERGQDAIVSLHQLREALEPHIAALAAIHATPEHLERMEEALRKMEQTLDNPEEHLPADMAFHSTLAEATGNDLFLLVIYPVVGLLEDAKYLAIQFPGATHKGQPYHQRVFDHVKNRQPEGARRVMQELLEITWHEIESHLHGLSNKESNQ
jgi:GntR family transcriptional repressor for pyruvate dehydrogenase complex